MILRPVYASNASISLAGIGGRAADRVFEAGDVVVADRHLEQGGVERRHTGERRDAVVRGDLPETRHQVLAAITIGRRQQHVVAMHPGQEAGGELRVDVKQRQAA